MKKILLCSFLCCELCMVRHSFSQAGEWVWIHGSNTGGSVGNFGVQGVSSPANDPPGVYEACEWRDLSGNFWLFGGLNSSYNSYGDLWKYNPVINEWVWMRGTGVTGAAGSYGIQGVSSPSNLPPSRAWGMASWVDNQGNLWMHGGYGSIVYADLWKYDITTNEWTWLKGPSAGGPGVYGTQGVPDPANYPGSRYECGSAWTDNAGDLWLFGGYTFAGSYNDLWRYNIASNEWTWMKGSQVIGAPNVYGTQGVEDPLNTPGARANYTRWKDTNGNLWMFAGYDWSSGNLYNDLWRFNPSTNNWAWIMGGSTSGQHGIQCTKALTNIPGGRLENRSTATDQQGNFWHFGGGVGSSFQECYNDLWVYCVSDSQWIWVSGDTSSNPAGNWGTMGVSSPTNKPNGRSGGNAWSDQNGSLYFFGGTDQAWPNMYNDLWKFTIDYNCTSCNQMPLALFTAPHHVCPGTCTDFTNLSQYATSYEWFFPGGVPSTSTDEHPANICYLTPGTYDVTLIATNSMGSDTTSLPNYITVFPYSPSQSIIQSGDTLFSNTGFVIYQWFLNGDTISGATNYFYLATQSGNYSVVCLDNNGCSVEAVILNVVAGILYTIYNQQPLMVYPNPVVDKFTIQNSQFMIEAASSISIYNMLGETVFSAVDCLLSTVYCGHFPSGMYYLEIKTDNNIRRTRFIKQ